MGKQAQEAPEARIHRMSDILLLKLAILKDAPKGRKAGPGGARGAREAPEACNQVGHAHKGRGG